MVGEGRNDGGEVKVWCSDCRNFRNAAGRVGKDGLITDSPAESPPTG